MIKNGDLVMKQMKTYEKLDINEALRVTEENKIPLKNRLVKTVSSLSEKQFRQRRECFNFQQRRCGREPRLLQ